MHPLVRPLYGAAGLAARAAAAVAPAGGGKLRQSLSGRRGVRGRLRAWASAHRDPARPLLWMHAPSVGEGLQARPVLELARRERPDVQIAYTHYSPSATRFAAGLVADGLADVADFLPFDTAGEAEALLAALAPRALVFSKLDVWPVLAERARRRGVALGLVSATLPAGSSRRGAVAGAFLRDAYAALDAVGAIDAEDAERLRELGVRPGCVQVTGDTRYDQVWRRARAVAADDPRLAAVGGPAHAAEPVEDGPAADGPIVGGPAAARRRFTVVAGSTWPADEAAIADAWTMLRRDDPDARLVLAPHEPTAGHLAPLERWSAAAGLACSRLSALVGAPARVGDPDVVLVDSVGVLAELYAAGDAAFVGGGFHAAGLHSVLEPAAFGIPVGFGPRHGNSRDASLLVAAGGASAVPTGRALGEIFRRWRGSDALRRHAGARARGVVEAGLGADARAWGLVRALLG
jgi:3-deoxy-D-manno-octulosonic-acid transferase